MNITLIRRTQIPFVASKFGQLKSQAKKCGVNKSFIHGTFFKINSETNRFATHI